MTRDDDVIARV